MTPQPAPVAAQMQNPLAFHVDGVPVYRVRKNDDDPSSTLQKYWYSFFADNSQPIDVRTLAGYTEPQYVTQGSLLERIERWELALATEAEWVIRLSIQNGSLHLPTTRTGWECLHCGHKQAVAPQPEPGEQWGRCPSCEGN